MKKAFRIVTWVLALLVTVCVLAFGALYIFADPNKLKPAITNEVMKRTGYHLVFDGNLSWSIYPQLGVKAEHITLTAPNQNNPFIDLRRVNIAVEPWQIFYGTSKLRGEVHIAEAVLMGVHMTSALVGLHWQDGAIILRPVQAYLYGGSLSGVARGKDFSAVPAWNWDVSLSHVDMLPLLVDANGDSSKLRIGGTGQLRINGSSRGRNSQEMLSNVNGVTNVSVKNGKLEGIDFNYLIKSADALLNKQSVELPQGDAVTNFESFTGSIVINNGLAQSNDLILSAPAFNVKGQGQYNLPARTINLALQVSSEHILNAQWRLPVLVRGEVARPEIQLDMDEINKQLAAHELDKMKDKVKDQIKQNIPGKTGEYLQSLIGN